MIKSLFRFGSHAFIIITLLSHLFSFGRHHEEEERRKEKRGSMLMSALALIASVAALGFVFDERRAHRDHHHLL